MKPTRFQAIDFLDALAFGTIAPLLFYMIALPFAGWIGLLFLIDASGRICGKLIGCNSHIPIAASPIVTTTNYLLLTVVGYGHTTHFIAFAIIYASRFLAASASGRVNHSRCGPISMVGFAAGCVITAIISNGRHVPASILETGGLFVPAIVATLISFISFGLAFLPVLPNNAGSEVLRRAGSSDGGPGSSDYLRTGVGFLKSSLIAVYILLACEAALAMILCVGPLTQREIGAFTPALTASYFAVAALLSITTSVVANHLLKKHTRWRLFALAVGITSAAMGFAGFTAALYLSWQDQKYHGDGTAIAVLTFWISALPIAIGHGLMRSTLPWLREEYTQNLPNRISLDILLPAVGGISAMVIALIWAAHERSAFALPASMMLIAAMLTTQVRHRTSSNPDKSITVAGPV